MDRKNFEQKKIPGEANIVGQKNLGEIFFVKKKCQAKRMLGKFFFGRLYIDHCGWQCNHNCRLCLDRT